MKARKKPQAAEPDRRSGTQNACAWETIGEIEDVCKQQKTEKCPSRLVEGPMDFQKYRM
jgi:hypothetical protein